MKEGVFEGFELAHSKLDFKVDGVVVTARIEQRESQSAVACSGVLLGGTESSEFTVQFKDLSSGLLLSPELMKLMNADFTGDGKFQYSVGKVDSLSVSLKSPQLNFGGLDCFAVLSEVLGQSSYRRVIFSTKAELTVNKDLKGCALKDINLEEKGVIKIRGELKSNESGVISGRLKVGLPKRYQSRLELKFGGKYFLEVRGDYLWQTVLVEDDQDDLRSMLRNSQKTKPHADENSELRPAPSNQQELEDLFDQLITD